MTAALLLGLADGAALDHLVKPRSTAQESVQQAQQSETPKSRFERKQMVPQPAMTFTAPRH